MSICLDASQSRADKFTCAQTRGVPEIEQETQSWGGRGPPTLRPFESVGERAYQQPFAFGKTA